MQLTVSFWGVVQRDSITFLHTGRSLGGS